MVADDVFAIDRERRLNGFRAARALPSEAWYLTNTAFPVSSSPAVARSALPGRKVGASDRPVHKNAPDQSRSLEIPKLNLGWVTIP